MLKKMAAIWAIYLFLQFSIAVGQRVPNRPEGVSVDCSSYTGVWPYARIHWKPVADNGSPIVSFELQYNISSAPDIWEVDDSEIPPTSTSTPFHLRQGNSYSFRIIARNKNGPSIPSHHSTEPCTIRPSYPTWDPFDIKGKGSTSSNLVISWRPTPLVKQSGPNYYYIVQWKLDDNLSSWQSKTIHDWRVGQLVIENQPTYRRYRIRVRAANELGKSLIPTKDIIGYSGMDKPTESPANFKPVKLLDTTTGMFSWDPVNPSSIRGKFEGYKIQTWTDQDEDDNRREILVGNNSREAIVDKLVPLSKNYVIVLVYNTEYNGPNSRIVQVVTDEVAFRAWAYPLGASALYLKWQKLEWPNGMLTGYRIYYQNRTGAEIGGLMEREPPIMDPEVTDAKLAGLQSGTRYLIHVKAIRSNGSGESCLVDIDLNRVEEPNLISKPDFTWAQENTNVPDYGRIAIRVRWVPNVRGNESAGSHFLVEFRRFNDSTFNSTPPELSTLTSLVKGLEGNETYVLRVVSVDGAAQNASEPRYIRVYQYNATYSYATPLVPEISIDPITQTVQNGHVVVINCHVFADKPFSVEWLKGDRSNLPNSAVINGTQLMFRKVHVDDSGLYLCRVTNVGGTAEAIAEIRVKTTELPSSATHFPIKRVKSTRKLVVALGQTVKMECSNASSNSSVSWGRIGDTLKRTFLVSGATLTIPNVQKNDSGSYQCETVQKLEVVELFVQVTSPPLIKKQPQKQELWFHAKQCEDDVEKPFILECEADGDPKPEYKWLKDGIELDLLAFHGRILRESDNGSLVFNSPRNEDSGQYQCLAYNVWGTASTSTVFLRKAELKSFRDKETIEAIVVQVGEPFGLACASPGGWPKPRIDWVKQESQGAMETISSQRHTVDPDGTLWFAHVDNDDIKSTLVYTCAAYSDFTSETTFGHRRTLISSTAADEGSTGLSIVKSVVQYTSKNHTIIACGSTVRLWCIIGGRPVPEIVWRKNGKSLPNGSVEYENYGKTLKIQNADFGDDGVYTCSWTFDDADGVQIIDSHSMQISIFALPHFTVEPQLQHPTEGETVEIMCEATGEPAPKIMWTQNSKPLPETEINPRRTVLEDRIVIENVTKLDTSNYGCNASNKYGYIYKNIFINVLSLSSPEENSPKTPAPPADNIDRLIITVSCTSLGAFALLFIALFLIRRKYKTKMFTINNGNALVSKEEIDTFHNGDASVKDKDDNVYKVPYDKNRYEIPCKSFSLDKDGTLGSGEFGWVCRGKIKIGCEEISVAVKMANPQKMRKTVVNGLLSEIKVLAYVGSHENITQLLGANTLNLKAGRVYIFLEMCPLGSLEKYLRKLRPLNDCQAVDEPDAEKRKSCNLTEMKTFSRTPVEPSVSEDLYRWSKEICNAMAFLATKHVVHADLATRNVLLGSNKEAKICDFGLSRRMYNYASYVKSQQEPLPWKWMAPESLRIQEFNEKTDVWAYGVTLWEIYSFGDGPYQGLSWDLNFSNRLEAGFRLGEPQYNDKDMYSVMKKCWELSPDARPSFDNLKAQF